jgi:hypothetical protein
VSVRLINVHIVSIVSIFSASSLMAQESIEQTEEQQQTAKVEEAAGADGEQIGTTSKFRDPEDGKYDISQMLLDNLVGFMPIPIIITEPAVDNGLGIAGAFFHKAKADQMQPSDGNLILPNISVIAGAYTGNDSWLVGAGHFRNWAKDRYRYNIMGGYANVNLDWYGNGNFPVPDDGLRFNVEGAMLDQGFLMRMGESRWYMGAELRVFSNEVSFDLGLPVDLDPVEETVVGASAVALYENLDYRLSPRKGFQAELKATVNDEAIGSDYDFQEASWELRQYFEFAEKYFFSWRLDGSTTSGDVPFYMEPFVDLAGIAAMRYQGPTAATVEIRGGVDLTPRWSVLGFAGAGRTADSISDLSSADTHSAYGTGFRYLLARQLGIRAGIDIAKGPEETYWYLIVGTAW